MKNWEETSSQVSDMQARGLGYGSLEVPSIVKQQAETVKMIYDTVKTAITKGDVIFA